MRLTKNELSFLSKTYDKKNPLNLFASVSSSLQGDELETLEKKGILKGGKPTQESHELLSAVADPQRCTRLVLRDGTYFIEKYAYKSEKGFTLTENSEGEVIFSPPQKLDEVLFQLSQWVGMSDLKTFDLGSELSDGETVVLLAVVDIRRAGVLRSYLGQEAEREISLSQIRGQLENPKPGSLTRILTGNYNFSIPTKEDTKAILDQLRAKKILEIHKGYILLGPYEEFASKFLIPETVVMLETFNLTKEIEIAGAGVLCICAGMKEIISIVFREGKVELTSISGRQLLKMMEDFLNCPDVL